MTDTLHNLVDDSCNLLELQEQYTESLNCSGTPCALKVNPLKIVQLILLKT